MNELIQQIQTELRNSNLVQVAKDTGLGRATLYRVLNEPENVKLETFLSLVHYFGGIR